MSRAVENLMNAQKHAMQIRPKAGGFPVLAEVLRAAGVSLNTWSLPSCQSLYLTEFGPVMSQMAPLATGLFDVPAFDREALITALRKDQEGRGSFPEFLSEAWQAGVVRYDVDFNSRKVTYYGARNEAYVEEYPAVQVS